MQSLDGKSLAPRWDEAQTVAAWLRHAAGQVLLQAGLDEYWINSFVLGHTPTESIGRRLSFVPLPSVGDPHSDGRIHHSIIVGPPRIAALEAETLHLLRVKLFGWKLREENRKAPRAVLVAISGLAKLLRFYVSRSNVWETVTPVVLHGYNTAHGLISLSKTDRLLRQAFNAAGFPRSLIQAINFQRASYWAGCKAAADIRVARHLAQWPRVHVHVEFSEPVQGPVLVGIGRHYGIGLFAAR
jgi:CRISPR-associated protein Csb2